MKLTAFFILATCLHVNATDGYGQKVTLSEREVHIEKIFTEIKKQTGFNFLYTSNILTGTHRVTVNVTNALVTDVLDIILAGQGLEYRVKGEDNLIIIKTKPQIKTVAEAGPAQGDPIDVSGKVTDGEGRPLPGANVKVRGTAKGVTADNNGLFVLKNVSENAVLEISFVGYEMKTFSVRGEGFITVALYQKLSLLDETVVIAYGTTSRRFTTGNVAKVKAVDIEKQPVNNPLLALQGRVAGLVVTQNTGVPGGGITVRVQGQNSIIKGSDPLYVIDGVPYLSQLPDLLGGNILGESGPTGSSIPLAGNPLSYINPADIESIEVLKDADATAIYGSRAANGAILITTKKGTAGVRKIDINLRHGWGQVGHRLDLLNTSQYVQMRQEALRNDGLFPSSNPDANRPFEYAPDIMLWDTTQYTDWQKELIGNTAKLTTANASISGGTAALQFLLAGTFHHETTVFPGAFSDKKGSLHFDVGAHSSNQKFHIQLSGSYLVDQNILPPTDLTQSAILLEPNAPSLYMENGMLNWKPNSVGYSSFNNPIAALNSTFQNKVNNVISNGVLKYQIINGLEVVSSFGYTILQSNQFIGNPLTTVKPENQAFISRTASYGYRTFNSWSIEPQLNYKGSVWKGKLDALFGTTILESNSDGQRVNATGFTNDFVLKDINSAASISKGGSFFSQYKYNAIFGRLNYILLDEYIVNLTMRRDGSSRFGPQNQFHNFWSGGFAWIFSRTKLIKDHLRFVSFGKLKASYGTTGSDQIGDYQFLNLYNPTANIDIAYQGVSVTNPTSLNNPYLAWEETKKLSLGLDLGFLKDRILFNFIYARNRSSNQLLPYTLPSITGFSAVTTNFPATIENSNWEFTLNTINLATNGFNWSTSFNLTIPKNKLVDFPNLTNSLYASSLVVGQPITISKAFRFMGVSPATGLYLFKDSRGNPTSTPNFLTDRTELINTLPKFYGGFQNSVGYKGFQLDFLFQFVKQVARSSNIHYLQQFPGVFYNGGGNGNQSTSVLNQWKQPGDITSIQRFSTTLSNASLIKISDAGYDDASFIRLKNISISWQLPARLRKNISIQNCRLYFLGQNLLTFTKYNGLDPENQSIGALPPLRVITIGLQVGF